MPEFGSFEGRCKYCGNIVHIMAADQKDADIKVMEDCSCYGHIKAKRLEGAKGLIDEYFSEKCIEEGFCAVDDKVVIFMHKAAEMVNEGLAGKMSITLSPLTRCVMSLNSKGVLKVQRVDSFKCEGGAQ